MSRFSKGSFLRNVFIMFSGSILAQIILVLVSPVLTRIYTPLELGQFTIFITIASVLLPILNGRYEIKVVSVDNKEDADALITLSIIISVIFLFLLSVTITLIDLLKVNFLDINSVYLYLLLPFIILGSINNILTSYTNRLKKYKLMSSVLFFKSLTQASLQVLMGILSFSVWGLIVSYIISLFSGLLIQIKEIKKHYKFMLNRRVIKVFKDYKGQLLFSTPSILANGLSYALIVFMIASLFSSHEVGMYSITIRVLGLPLTLIALSFSKVFYERAFNDYQNLGQFTDIYVKISVSLLFISLPIFTVIAIFSPSIFPIVFGEEWSEAGQYILYLTPMYIIRLIVSSLSLSIIIINKQKIELLLQFSFILSCGIVYFATKLFSLNIYEFLTLISVFFSLNYLAFYFYIFMNSKR
ncbi:oligosaccharide flippase family protein [Planomicrobium sp. Y74]|uniref:lipopolysaccharide biosynthesis protein n=1 Tax=Planomicrobium sp. Y74 TaxID=2478977 RepID=UPI000EF5526A|nr:oligosaccharide flippase family protein [Planomicrobium sp. Y74]RLQ86713.1 hypothetical protein D9754_14935 [Planomicrobium sp. Y74]